MPKCSNDNQRPVNFTNLFVDLNGFQYLLGEYLDRQGLQMIDRSAVASEICVDASDSMRAVIYVNIDDIGKLSSGYPNITGNNAKQRRLVDLISKNAYKLDGQLPVLKSGIVVRVNYQLENQRTRRVMRSMVEDLRIINRNYYVDINQRNPNDNAVIVNFSNSIVSTINEFTHGRDRMQIRITNIQLFYEAVTERQPIPRVKQSLTAHPYDGMYNNVRPGTPDEYYYHSMMQNTHFMGDPYDRPEEIQQLCPPHWAMFNQFYHFDQEGRSIVLHNQEIYDPMSKVTLIPCGKVNVNRTFIINPGHRLIFNFSIWKNDVTSVADTLSVAQALKAKFYNCCDTSHDCDCGNIDFDGEEIVPNQCNCNHHNRPAPPERPEPPKDHRGEEYHQLVQMLYDERQRNQEQGNTITELLQKIKELEETIANSGITEDPEPDDCDCGCDCDADHDEINTRIDELAGKVAAEDIDPMSPDTVEEIFREVVNSETTTDTP